MNTIKSVKNENLNKLISICGFKRLDDNSVYITTEPIGVETTTYSYSIKVFAIDKNLFKIDFSTIIGNTESLLFKSEPETLTFKSKVNEFTFGEKYDELSKYAYEVAKEIYVHKLYEYNRDILNDLYNRMFKDILLTYTIIEKVLEKNK
jgi:hypothetical protein